MYVKKEDRLLIEEVNRFVDNWIDTKEFYNFIESQKLYIGIYDKNNKCLCSKCNKKFKLEDKYKKYTIIDWMNPKFMTTCPYCNQELILKRSTNFMFKDYVMYLIPYKNKKYILRNYEILNYFNKTMKHKITEYGRQIVPGYMGAYGYITNGFIINTMRRNISGYQYINYNEEIKYWKPESYILYEGRCYVDNNTINCKYYDPKQIFDNSDVNVPTLINEINHKNYTIELLTKAKLYNLIDYFNCFNPKQSFERQFGVDKSYLKFMQDVNITHSELQALRLVKIKDYALINYLSKFHRLENLLEYCKPYDLFKYNLKKENEPIYLDYLEFCKKLKYNLKDKKILYPKQLHKKHDELLKLMEINKNKKTSSSIERRYKKLQQFIYRNKKYIIFPVKTIDELLNESKEQNNCVKTYAERIAKGQCDIYFMRLLENQDKSLVTVEVRNNKVVQQRTKNNADTTKEQKTFLKTWERKVLNPE